MWDAVQWAMYVVELGAGEILLTSMDEDGQLTGYDLDLTRTISEAVEVPVIASGGAGELDHLYQAFNEGKADAVLAASIFSFRHLFPLARPRNTCHAGVYRFGRSLKRRIRCRALL